MRYLWIEDFDGGKSGRTEIRSRLEKYFQLEDKYINRCTLQETLSFLDNPENWKKFDVILIDIRFKVADTEQDEEQIYNSYFSGFLTYEKYKEYTYRIGGDVNSASAGVLLYLALVHRYNCNEERIAFISANVDNNSADLIQINDMKEFALKAKYEPLSEEDIQNFSLLNEDAFEKYKEVMGSNDDFEIPTGDKIDWEKPEVLLEEIDKVLNKIQKKIKANKGNDQSELKYNSVKQEFEGVGLKVPRAFEKPTGDTISEISWQFKSWVDSINTDYYKLRSIILNSCLHLKKLFNTETVKNMPYKKMTCNYTIEKSEITAEAENMIGKIEELFPINEWILNDKSFYMRVIKECVSLADRIHLDKDKNKEEKSVEDVAKETLKLVRNWTSHQGIGVDVSSFDVAYIYMMMLYVYFNCDECTDDINDLKKLLIKLADLKSADLIYEEETEKTIDTNVGTLEETARETHKEAYDKFKNEVGEEKAKKLEGKYRYNENAGIFDVVSGIGNQFSPFNKRVCMKYVYLVYLSTLKQKKDDVYKCIYERNKLDNEDAI